MNGLDNLVPFAPSQRSTIAFVPINQLTDTMNWTRGNHTFEFGTDLFQIRDNRSSTVHAMRSTTTSSTGRIAGA
jgi:hypothetical protein